MWLPFACALVLGRIPLWRPRMARIIHSKLEARVWETCGTFANLAEGDKSWKGLYPCQTVVWTCLNKGMKGCSGKGLDLGVLDASSRSKYLLIWNMAEVKPFQPWSHIRIQTWGFTALLPSPVYLLSSEFANQSSWKQSRFQPSFHQLSIDTCRHRLVPKWANHGEPTFLIHTDSYWVHLPSPHPHIPTISHASSQNDHPSGATRGCRGQIHTWSSRRDTGRFTVLVAGHTGSKKSEWAKGYDLITRKTLVTLYWLYL